MELEGRPKPALMLKEWLELEFIAELSRGGFGCYPRHLVAGLTAGTRRNGDVIARLSAAVRAVLFWSAGREGQAALSGNSSRRLRMGFWKKSREDEVVPSCSASTTASGRGGGLLPAKSPRRRSWGSGQSGGAGAGTAGRRSHETEVTGMTATRHLDQEQERKQRLSPVSVMDFLSQDEDDGDEHENGNGAGEDDDETASPTFQRSIANIRRVSQQLLQNIRQFEQLAELDISDVDDATTTTEDVSCHMVETNSTVGSESSPVQGLLDLLEESSSGSTHCFQKLLIDFFRDEKIPKGQVKESHYWRPLKHGWMGKIIL